MTTRKSGAASGTKRRGPTAVGFSPANQRPTRQAPSWTRMGLFLALLEVVWGMCRPSGRGIPLSAGSPRCCNEPLPGCGSPHPPRRGGFPIRPCLLHPLGTRCSAECNGYPEEQRVPEAWTVGPRSGDRFEHQRGSPARSRLPLPDGLARTPGKNRSKARLRRSSCYTFCHGHRGSPTDNRARLSPGRAG